MERQDFGVFKHMILDRPSDVESAISRTISLIEEDERIQFRTRVGTYRILTRVQRGRAETWGDWDLAPPVWAHVDHGELYVGSDATTAWPAPSQTNLDFPTFYNVHLAKVGGSLKTFMWQYADTTEPLPTVRNPLPVQDFFSRRLDEIEGKLTRGEVKNASSSAYRLSCVVHHVLNVPRYIEAFREQATDPLLYFRELSADHVQEMELAIPAARSR